MINRRVRPLVFSLGTGRLTRLYIGTAGIGQAIKLEFVFAKFQQTPNGRKIFRLFYCPVCCLQNLFRPILLQVAEPELFGILEFFKRRKRLVVLIVVNQLKLGKHLIDGINGCSIDRFVRALLPSCGLCVWRRSCQLLL